MLNLQTIKSGAEPYKHLYSVNFVEPILFGKMLEEFPSWDDQIWDKIGKTYKTDYGYKKELPTLNGMPPNLREYILQISSNNFVSFLAKSLEIDDEIVFDFSLYGGGLNLFPPGSKLGKHIDFNFNDKIGLYRSINVLLYLNQNWESSYGGELELYNEDGEKKAVPPLANTMVAFAPNQKAIHAVSENAEGFYRKSISIWYYTKKPQKHTSVEKHRTIWL